MNTVSSNVSIVKTGETAKRLSEMLEGCFRRTEASSLNITKQRYESIHKEIDTDFYDFVKVRLLADEELRTKNEKSEFSVEEIIVKVVCENINSGELDTCYNIWKPFRDEKLWAYDGHFTHLRDLEVNLRNDMLVYFWSEYASTNCLGNKYNLWWVITAREDDGYLVFKDVLPSDIRSIAASFSMKHTVKLPKTNKNMKQTTEGFVHKNKGERIMKEYGNKGAFGMNIPSPNSYGWDGDPEWSISTLKDGKLYITKALPNDGSKSFIISVEDDGNTLNIINHTFTTVKTVSKELNDLTKDKQDDLENNKLRRPFFTQRDPALSLKDMIQPLSYKGFINHEDELRMEGNIVGDLYSVEPIDPESKKFFDYEEGVTTINVLWTGLTWALYDGLKNPEKFKGFIDNVNSLKNEAGVKEDTILAFNTISKKYERYEHDGSGWVQWGLTTGSMKYTVPSATTVSNHFQLPDGRFMKKNTLYIINSDDSPLYQTGQVCLVNQRENGWINRDVIDRTDLTVNKIWRPAYIGIVYGSSIDSLDQFNQKYCRITGDTISVKTKQNIWMDYVWDGEHWYEIPTNVPNIQFKGVIAGLHVIPENEARRGDVYFCIKEKEPYIYINGDWKPFFS